MKLLSSVRNNIIVFVFAFCFMLLAFNMDLVYKSLYNIGIYDGNINDVSFNLKSQWYLCESTEEGVFSLSEYEFPMITYCDGGNGKIQFFPWLEKRTYTSEIKIVNNVKLGFLRYIEPEDKVVFLHEETMMVVTASPSSSIENVVDIVSLRK